MTLLAVADTVWLAAIAGLVAIGTAWIKMSADRHAKAAAVVQDQIHTLVNNNMGVQLKLVMELSEWKAMTSPLPEHIAAAKSAREKYDDHQRRQASVDAESNERKGPHG